MAKRENLSVSIDYLTLVAENVTAEEFILYFLDYPPEIFLVKDGRIQHKRYTTLYHMGSIKVHGDVPPSEDNPKGLGCYLTLSGSGCRQFFRHFCKNSYDPYLNEYDYSSFFRFLNRRHSRKYRSFEYLDYHITRLDIAIDDKNEKPFFTIEKIHNKCLAGEYISNSRSSSFHESDFRRNDTAKTVYIGNGKSNISYRFYDKDKKYCKDYDKTLEEVGSWKRTELQLRDETAHELAQLIAGEPFMVGKQIFDLLGSSLRFVVPDKNQANRSRLKTCRFWERFLGAIKPLKLSLAKPDNNLFDTQKWLKQGGSLSAVKAFLFLQQNDALGDLEDLETLMHRLRFSQDLSGKISAHLYEINRQDLIPELRQNTRAN